MTIGAIVEKLRRVVSFHGVGAGAQLLALAAVRRQLSFERVYVMEMAACPPQRWAADGRTTRFATASDIVAMTKDRVWDMTDLSVEDVHGLFAAGHRCVLNVVDGRIGGYAWMNPKRMVVPKLRTAITLGQREIHVYKGFTHPDYRGQRLGVDRFCHWYTQLVEPQGLTVLVDFAFDNPATLARAERSGLRKIGTATYLRRGRFERLWVAGALAGHERRAIPYDIAHRDH